MSYFHDALSRITQKSFSNGVSSSYAYDQASQLTSLTSSLQGPTGDEAISSFAYTYDNIGNRTSLTTTRSIPGINQNLTYGYDDLNRLTDATRPLSGDVDESFTYDESGNRIQRDGDTQVALFDPANRLLEDSLFTYTHYCPNV